MQDDFDGAVKAAGRLQDIFGRDNFFIEMQDHGIPEQHRTNPMLLELAAHLQAPLLATNDSHYVERSDAVAHDALLCVQTGSQMSDPDRFKFHGDEHYLKSSQEMRHLFDEIPEACDNTLWIAERADVTIEFGKPQLPDFPLPEGFVTDAEYLRHLTFEGAKKRWGQQLPDHIIERLAYELAGHRVDGVLVVLPHHLGPDQARPRRQHPRRSGPWLGGRLRGGLLALDHRPRPDQVRPAVRALPQPEPHLDARHRHGLRLPLPGRDDPLRGGEVRARPRGPDRHVLHHQGPGRRARRRPRPRVPVHRRGQGGQGHAAARDGARHAALRLPRAAPEVRGRLQDGRRPPEDARRGSRRRQGDRGGQGPRGPAPPGRHPRRCGGDHQGAAHHLPADPAQARGRQGHRGRADRHAVRDARRRRPRAAQDGLPRPAQPRRHQRHPRDHRSRPAASTLDIDAVPLDDEITYELLRRGEGIGIFQLEGGPMRALMRSLAPTTLRGHLRAPRAVPARPDGRQHAQRLRRPEERPEAGRAPAPRRRGGAGRHLRADDLPGEPAAGRAEVRRLLPGRGRPAPPGVRQEEAGSHRAGAREVRRRLPRPPATAPSSASSTSTSSSRSPTTPSPSRTPTATATSPTRPPTSRRTTRPSTSPRCSRASRPTSTRRPSTWPSAARWASRCWCPT